MARQRIRGGGGGRITSGIKHGQLVKSTIEFVLGQLPKWRDDPTRPAAASEETLNGQLCKFLNAQAREHFPMAHFHHEEPQTKRRRVDISVATSARTQIDARLYSIYEPFFVIEGKRLPLPSKNREKEYVTGFDKQSGGIQRFKMGLHGARVNEAAMVGYLQQGDPVTWHARINGWISELASDSGSDVCKWAAKEELSFIEHDVDRKVARCTSLHRRLGRVLSKSIRLHHLWVEMAPDDSG